MDTNVQIIKKFRWFWAWDDDKEEVWLRDMSEQGFHMERVIFPGIYTFVKDPEKAYVYRMDYSPDIKKKEDYLNLFRDAGWAYMGSLNYWQYFRKEVGDSLEPEIFTDNESKTIKYKRIISLLAAILPLTVVNIVNLSNMSYRPAAEVLTVLMVVCLVFLLFGIGKMLKRINELKNL